MRMPFNTLIDGSTLHQCLADSSTCDWVLLDCRFNLMQPDAGLAAYQQGHIPGAVYADLNTDLSSKITATSGRHPLPAPDQLAQRLGEWGIAPTTQVVVYDDMGGAMASRAWWLLRWLGHDPVALLDGGLPAWIAAGGELIVDLPQVSACAVYPLRLSRDWVVSSEAVQANLSTQAFTLVDARNVERFRGEQEPIDPIAGHVPGAINRPLSDNLNDQGLFKSASILRDEWLKVLSGCEAVDAIHMCGSGVTACHNQLAMEVAGLSGSRVYTGSWSEWIRDPGHPVAVN
jgi:thiosulfate/3-mercaptopyruvate sulfurtransferase